MRVEKSQVIDRPVGTVFRFFADNHVQNHPRWDPDVELRQLSDGPIGLGTSIARRNRRLGTPVEGSMEVVEFERERAFGTLIHDGPMEMRGGATFEALAPERTRLTLYADASALNDPAIQNLVASRMERSVQTIKELIEAES